MRPKVHHTAPRPRPGWQLMLLATLLFAGQLLLAVHGVDHLDGDAGDAYDVCLVGQHLGHGLTTQHVTPQLPPAAAPQPQHLAAALAEQPAPTPCQRGPPLSLRIV